MAAIWGLTRLGGRVDTKEGSREEMLRLFTSLVGVGAFEPPLNILPEPPIDVTTGAGSGSGLGSKR